jgi:hypothetical protein
MLAVLAGRAQRVFQVQHVLHGLVSASLGGHPGGLGPGWVVKGQLRLGLRMIAEAALALT